MNIAAETQREAASHFAGVNAASAPPMTMHVAICKTAMRMFMGSNVRHERWRKGREAAFGTSARWRG